MADPESRRGGGARRVLAKLKASVAAGEYYEAHQMYRSLYFRYNAQKKYAEAIDLLYSGAMDFLKHDQHESGADLAMLLLEIMKNASSAVDNDSVGKLVNIHKSFQNSQDRIAFTSSAIKWASMGENQKYHSGHPDLHQQLALNLWQEKNYAEARYHFLHSTAGEECANMLIEYHNTKGYPSEVDLFVAQAVLQYLCRKNKQSANVVFFTYTRSHPLIKDGPPFMKPLLNFCWFLLLAVEDGKLTVFTILCEQYQTSIKRDPMYTEYLDRIGQIFFGVPPPQTGGGGLFGNLFQSLFNFEDDDEEMPNPGPQEPRPGPSTTPARPVQQEDLD
ncbi:Golgi to ER traffic protein 4 homolog [Lineus longissimus]|uniref:Golgi to ER traffic protein 4 homolog n=1 Tax=Lineus longissimus TaxID=88925 RepID=UPI00315C92C8